MNRNSARILFLRCWLPFFLACFTWLSPVSAQAPIEGDLAKFMQKELQRDAALRGFFQRENVGLWVGGEHPLLSFQENKFLKPASTTKLITAWLALQYWPRQHRFATDVDIMHFQNKTTIEVIGYGDPYLTSEVLKGYAKNIARELKRRGLPRVDNLVLNNSYFKETKLQGIGRSNNPYDAVPSALALNFNTINMVYRSGKWRSAEQQTPITQASAQVAEAWFPKQKPKKAVRLNMKHNVKLSQQHFAEVLLVFLAQEGVDVSKAVIRMQRNRFLMPEKHRADLRFFNTRTLEETVSSMMRYSTNFIANQLLLNLTVKQTQRAATLQSAQAFLQRSLNQSMMWKGSVIQEGAGLSHQNRITAAQMKDLLLMFESNIDLLPEVEKGVFAKSGTLLKVRTLAGYIDVRGENIPFVILVNEKVPYRYRNTLAKSLRKVLTKYYQPNLGSVDNS